MYTQLLFAVERDIHLTIAEAYNQIEKDYLREKHLQEAARLHELSLYDENFLTKLEIDFLINERTLN